MLVHVTRFTAVQSVVQDQVDEYLHLVIDSLRDRYGKADVRFSEFRVLWNQDFVSTTKKNFPPEDAQPLTWGQVSKHLLPALRKIQVKAVNGTSRDALDYYENRRNGFSVIAIGGQKLSRGLTLEGLTTSYYLRPSKTYDTLLQMGRWFGYRPGYEDLCRLYTTPALEAAYVEVTRATDELRREVEEMGALGLTPRQFGLKIRSSSLGLSVTAANKMRKGKKIQLSYSADGPETVIFDLSPRVVRSNFTTLENFVNVLDEVSTGYEQKKPGKNVVWKNVPAQNVVSAFLDRYESHPLAQRVRPTLISRYIEKCLADDELNTWTVCLVGVNNDKEDNLKRIGQHVVGLATRGALQFDPKEGGRYTIRRVLSPQDEGMDLDEAQLEAAWNVTATAARTKGKPEPKRASGRHLRWQRRADQALLLIYPLTPPDAPGADAHTPLVGFQISFPRSKSVLDIEYVVNDVWWRETDTAGDDEEGDT
jgi:hypothetical protein